MAKKIDRIEKLKQEIKEHYNKEEYDKAREKQEIVDQFFYGYQKK